MGAATHTKTKTCSYSSDKQQNTWIFCGLGYHT